MHGDISEVNMTEDRIIGRASARIPYVGYVKIGWTWIIDTIRGNNRAS